MKTKSSNRSEFTTEQKKTTNNFFSGAQKKTANCIVYIVNKSQLTKVTNIITTQSAKFQVPQLGGCVSFITCIDCLFKTSIRPVAVEPPPNGHQKPLSAMTFLLHNKEHRTEYQLLPRFSMWGYMSIAWV